MRSASVVVLSPVFDHDLRLLQAVEDLWVQAFVPELPVKTLAVPVLPRAARLDKQGFRAELCQPLADDFGRHLRAIVGSHVLGDAVHEHRVGERLDHPKAIDPACDANGETFTSELVNQRQQPQPTAVMRLPFDKIVRPHMPGSLGPQPHAGAIVEPQATPRSLLLGNLEPLAAPDPLHAILADRPARHPQHGGDPAIAIPTVLGRERHDRLRQRVLVGPKRRHVALRGARLADDPAGAALRETIRLPNASDGLPAPLGAYKFPCAMSFKICFSSARSATNRRSRAFSFSSSLRRLAFSTPSPPYSLRQR